MKKSELMTDEEIKTILPKLDGVAEYIDSIREYFLKKSVETGKKWKGYKVVESTTKRKISDEVAVVRILTESGYDPLLPKKLIGSYVVKPKGQAVLAPESDARKEFMLGDDKNV